MQHNTSDDIHHLYRYEFPTGEPAEDLFFFRHKFSLSVEFPYHEHELYEMYFHISGDVKFYITGKGYSLAPGDIILVRPGEIHRPVNESGKDYEMVILLVGKTFINKLPPEHSGLDALFDTAAANGSLYIPLKEERLHAISRILSKLEKSANKTAAPKASAMKAAHFLELLFALNGTPPADRNTFSAINSGEKVQGIIEYIHENIEKDLSLDALSAAFYVSKYHLSREFSKYAGCTLHQYILQKRLLLAKRLMDESNNLEGVIKKCGFEHYVTFLLAFKKRFGITPKEYMNQCTEK